MSEIAIDQNEQAPVEEVGIAPVTETVPITYGVMLHSDGGARPNPGCSGWGVHGYFYTTEPAKKGTGLSECVLTAEDYILKSTYNNMVGAPPQVFPLMYLDGYGSVTATGTNNLSELSGAYECLQMLETLQGKHPEPITQMVINTDSQYVVQGSEKYLATWKLNNWLKRDRTPVSNKELWQQFDSLIERIRARGVTVDIRWVRGHNGNFGNEIANRYATAAVIRARHQVFDVHVEYTKPEGYWSYKVERHPFLSHRTLFFNTLADYQIPGHYYIGEANKEIDLIGKKDPNGAFAFIMLSDPDPVLEMIRVNQSNLANHMDTFILMRLDYVYNPTNHEELCFFDKYALDHANPTRLDLYGLNEEPITRELRPPKLVFRAVEYMSDLSERLDQFLAGDTRYTVNDITSQFFDTVESVKKGKDPFTSFKLKESLGVGVAAIEVPCKYEFKGEIKERPLTLSLNIDLPNRNAIKRMEPMKPKVILLTWKESDMAVRYATVFSTDTDCGIWAGVYSNLIVVTD